MIKKLLNRNIVELKDVDVNWLWDLMNKDLKGIELDDVFKFDFVKFIGQVMVDYIMEMFKNGKFIKDFIGENNCDLLVIVFGDIICICV